MTNNFIEIRMGRGVFELGNPERRGAQAVLKIMVEGGSKKKRAFRRPGVWIFSGITHCPFRGSDYSLLVSSCPLRGLFFFSCMDVISLDFPLSIHDSIIVKEKKNF